MDVSELKVTADLANIELGEEEFASLGREVEKMLDYFSKMMETDGMSLPSGPGRRAANRTRPDAVSGDADPDSLLENAPELEDRFIVIPNVL
ncbi:MAG: Asp-tRNA(Asn)/Glu-tRNA(Gln) amidotransferase subunit GatC [Spirochaetia bacterium]|jgi:aspartyl-tRNA(Asn)/glutamyl-tRNA(Gln) amidotransferase subunit C|nr:Asp-tRNA(Asn)/Glu-tRNA(Gln) amidotransferase subunit GatC [Spirochaetia bacterium]